MALGAQHRGLREDDVVAGSGTASRAWGQGMCCRLRHRLGSGKMVARKGLDRGQERLCGGSGVDSTMARRLWGGLDDGMSSRVVNDGAGSREIFGGKFWLPDGIIESLWGLGFAKAAQ
jgi:hypothetical protein